jgi:hypothetical protein
MAEKEALKSELKSMSDMNLVKRKKFAIAFNQKLEGRA